jgi:hypothetical protein
MSRYITPPPTTTDGRGYTEWSDDADDNADVLSKRHYLTDLNEYFVKNAYETSYRQKKEKCSGLLC